MRVFIRFGLLLWVFAVADCFGQFGEANLIDLNPGIHNNAFIDLDADGDEDILVPYHRLNEIVWHENLGNGEFSAAQHFKDLDRAVNVAVGDVDADGDLDVFACNWNSGLYWYENLGNANFSEANLIPTSSGSYFRLFSADIDNDGDADLVTGSGNGYGGVSWYESFGDGTFSAQKILLNANINVKSVYAADLDNDGDLEVMSASTFDDTVRWFENNGDGTFSSENIITTAANGASSVYAEDMDGDGDLEILATDNFSDRAYLFDNQGDGSFASITLSGIINGASSVQAADLDNDGDLDIIAAAEYDNKLMWFENLGGGDYASSSVITSQAVRVINTAIQDLDNDGDVDILWLSNWNNSYGWFENDGTSNFTVHHKLNSGVNTPGAIQLADLDNDGDLDLVASGGDRRMTWYENLDNGNFSKEKVIATGLSGEISFKILFCADLDDDGDIDIFGRNTLNTVAFYENLGDAVFQSTTIYGSLSDHESVILTDADGDGDLDVCGIFAGINGKKIFCFRNDGSGNFEFVDLLSTGSYYTSSILFMDLDEDGDQDILTGNNGNNRLAWHENLGNNQYSEEVILQENVDLRVITKGDLDGDGLEDLILPEPGGDRISWMRNLANAELSPLIVIRDSNWSDGFYNVVANDFDNDGDLDLIGKGGGNNDVVYWFENYGEGAFSNGAFIDSDTGSASMAFGDIDGDGDEDVALSFIDNDMIAWYENQHGYGCMDPAACNYDEEAYTDDGSCCFGICGCTDPQAVNYNPEAVCFDESCSYGLSGWVFNDEDEDGIWDANESGLPFQEVIISPQQIVALTNDEGRFSVTGITLGQFTLEHTMTEEFPFATTDNPQSVNIQWNVSNQEILFGISNEAPQYGIEVSLYPNDDGYPCEALVMHDISFLNQGNVTVDGVIELEYDPLFVGYYEMSPIDSVVDNRIYMSFQGLMPGQSMVYHVRLFTPSTDMIGEELSTHAKVFGYYNEMEVAFGENTYTDIMTCAYDPNDKQVFPVGFTEEHLILENTNLDYLLRFQNTGNAPATNILVTDTIDENLDLGSFQLKASSHSVMVTIRPDLRVIEFYFENIMLPDSTNNEPESHGLVLYQIEPKTGLSAGTVLHNTANIYFDNNPPIITNTTWTTIHECGGEAEFSVESEVSCLGQVSSFSSLYPWVEDYTWSLDGEETSNASTFETNFTALGEYTVLLEASNPLCTSVSSIAVVVDDLTDTNPCPGDFNCDGERTVGDLNAFLTEFGCNLNCLYDLNGDGITATNDLVVFLSYFGSSCAE